jgi:osmotically-inducible protein OsmY
MIAKRLKKAFYASVLMTSVAISLQGCPLVLLGAVGGGALIATDRRTLGTQAEDREIQIKIATQFAHHLPKTAHIRVAVFNQQVLLTGEAPNLAIKEKAQSIARQVTGVKQLIDETTITGVSRADRPSAPNDAYLTTKVKAALVRDKILSANDFKVVSEHGTVYLMGLVTTEEGARAANIVSHVSGVLRVVKVFQYIPAREAAKRSFPKQHKANETQATPSSAPANNLPMLRSRP